MGYKTLAPASGWIALDTDHIESTTEAKSVCLAHEMGHIETNSFYNVHSPLDVRQKHENRANKWAIKQLITEEELDEAVANGHTCEIWDLADYFDDRRIYEKSRFCFVYLWKSSNGIIFFRKGKFRYFGSVVNIYSPIIGHLIALLSLIVAFLTLKKATTIQENR